METLTEAIAHTKSTVLLGFRELEWAGDFNWSGTQELLIDWFKIMPLDSTPAAKFVASHTTVQVGEKVLFYEQSPTATSYEWDFPGGTPATSTDRNPSVVYSKAGVYDVTLVSTNTNGSRTETKTAYITVGDQSLNINDDVMDSQ